MEVTDIDLLVKKFHDIFGHNDVDFVNITGKSMVVGRDGYYDVIFRNSTSYTYQKFSYLYRKYLKELAEQLGLEVHRSKEFQNYYYWSPKYSLTIGDVRLEFGRRAFSKRYLDHCSTHYYLTTNNRYFVDQICNIIMRYKKLHIKKNSIYE